MKRTILIITLTQLITGCAWMTGLENAEDDFACSLEMPAMCASLSDVHESIDKGHNEVKVTLQKSFQTPVNTASEIDSVKRITLKTSIAEAALGVEPDSLYLPVREREEIARIWLAPYVDRAGELYGEQFVWVTVKAAHWCGLPAIGFEKDSPKMLRPLGLKKTREASLR